MKKFFSLIILLVAVTAITACSQESYAGTYTGYSWQGESQGVLFEDATQHIEATITLDKKGIIVAAEIDFKVLNNGVWQSRADQNVTVSANFSTSPSIADPRITGRQEGTSMFTIQTVDEMSLYVYAVDQNGTVAFGVVCPVTRYLFEMKFDSTFDFNTPMSDITIQNGTLVPTRLTSTGSFLRPATWESIETKNIFNMHYWSHVLTSEGVFQGMDGSTTVKSLLESVGITFVGNVPQAKAASFGFFGIGGWKGNFDAIADYLIGQDATTFTGIIDWTISKYQLGINEDNFFGIGDLATGATRTVQDSIDTIAGATVRVSREATAIQRALVAAGFLSEEDVIKGRF